MIDDQYKIEASEAFRTFVFTSEGPKGSVLKIVRYIARGNGIYNLGFGDHNPATGYISDTIRTDNKDSRRVLATVVSTLYVFMQAYPEAIVIAAGSTEARTRLYRMGITNNLDAILREFILFGLTNVGWNPSPKAWITSPSQYSINR